MDYIKLMRSLKDKSYYAKDSEKVHLWLHLLLSANWSEREEILGGKPIICKAGQFTTGRKQLSIATGISESKIERTLTYFEKIEQQIEQQKTNTNRLISILNWSKYQISEQPIAQRVNNKRTTNEQQLNTLKEYKETNNSINKEINTTCLSFDEFWDLYDKKVGKPNTLKLFEKTTEHERELIKNYIPKYKISKSEVKYRKDPERFLKNKVWEDEIITQNTSVPEPIKQKDMSGLHIIPDGQWKR